MHTRKTQCSVHIARAARFFFPPRKKWSLHFVRCRFAHPACACGVHLVQKRRTRRARELTCPSKASHIKCTDAHPRVALRAHSTSQNMQKRDKNQTRGYSLVHIGCANGYPWVRVRALDVQGCNTAGAIHAPFGCNALVRGGGATAPSALEMYKIIRVKEFRMATQKCAGKIRHGRF